MLKSIVRLLFALLIVAPLISCSTKPKEKADVTIWHWMTDRQPVFENIAKKYHEETGIRVVFETYAPSEVYRNKVRAAASGKLLPEIFSPLGDKRELSSFIKAGYIADLTEEMNKGWKNELFAKPLAQNTFQKENDWDIKPGIYGVPIDVNAIEIYYNKDLFKQAGLNPEKPPKTWKQFIEAGKKLRAANIQPFASGFGEGWLIGVFAKSYQWNLFGRKGVIGLIKGSIPYTDPKFVKILSLFEEMRENKLLASGIATMVNKDSERAFATGKVAMALNGSWGVNVYHGMNPNLNYGIMMPPRLTEGKYPLLIFGGEGSSLNVNAQSPNKDKAIQFLKWITSKEQQIILAKETRNIPVNKNSASGLPDTLANFAKNIKYTFEALPVSEDWQVVNAINLGLQSILIGEKNAEQVAKDIQTEKENRKKEKK